MAQPNTYQGYQYGGQQQYYMPQVNQIQQSQQQVQQNNINSNIIWIQGGLAGAKAYPVPPGCAYSLWDTENNVIYIKMVDMAGIPQPIRIFDYNERTESQESQNDKGYVTEERLNEILDEKFASFAQSIKENNNKKYSNHKGGKNYGKPAV